MRRKFGTIRALLRAMSPCQSAFSANSAVQTPVPAYAPKFVTPYEQTLTPLPAGFPTRAAAFRLADRVVFFGGRVRTGAQL